MDAIDPANWNQAVSVSVPILGLLLLGNLAFVGSLISKIKKLDETVMGTFPVYNNRLQMLEAADKSHTEDLKEVAALRERIAVCEYALRTSKVIQT